MLNLLEMSFAGGVLIAVICVVRLLGGRRLPAATFVILWYMAILRLLLPWKVAADTSIFALIPQTEATAVFSVATRPSPAQYTTNTADAAGAATPERTCAEDALSSGAQSTMEPVAMAAFAPDVWRILWLAGTALLGFRFAVSYAKWLRVFRESLPAEDPGVCAFLGEYPLRRRVFVRVSGVIRAPLTYGLFRPVILLPTNFRRMGTDDLKYVLLHEYVHIRRLDMLTKLLLTAVLCVHWFNPLVWLMYILANQDLELRCDEEVIFRSGLSHRPAYAKLLIQMEEQKDALSLFSGAGQGCLKGRITRIMKIRKRTAAAFAAAGIVAVSVGCAFATSPPETADAGTVNTAEVRNEVTLAQGTASEAEDSGEYQEVEWWTAQDYAAWLENEKAALQSLLGTHAWTEKDGSFIWTQEKIDEAIALYEETLRQIEAGYMVSKPMGDGSVLMQGSDRWTCGKDTILMDEYAPFGLSENGGELSYMGKKVRSFDDSVELEKETSASKVLYFDPEGTVNLQTVREPVQNADGSIDPFGFVTGLEEIPDETADELRIRHSGGRLGPFAEYTDEEVLPPFEATADFLKDYAPFGLRYELNVETDKFEMEWNGRPVHSLYDPYKEIWAAWSLNATNLGPDSVDLEAVYTDGKLTGLKEAAASTVVEAEVIHQETSEDFAVAFGSAHSPGRTLPEIFETYSKYGLTFEETALDGAIRYNLFLNGKPVNHFSDERPDGGTFTFDSAVQHKDGLSAKTRYGESGILTGIDSKQG